MSEDELAQDVSASTDPCLALNLFSDAAKSRTNLFVSITERDGLKVIPGRYGGEYNNDMLAIGEANEKTILMLGVKLTSPNGDLQLDACSMGPHMQFSPEWLDAVIYSLSLSGDLKSTADRIASARDSRTLVMGVMFVERETGKLNIVAVSGASQDS